ncbi:hypothetical protein [Segniliparus rugosus]|uniref:Nucleotidyltransferase domain-containing protein n=1 Tax=Segniliparus rugosus (strain ATCC BAA-974 / DSM 45345 / CCUG 50838 / CIP 108380 / JCM 13579 / CDC 945) TaxID=679197 RepID=E5XSE5_SEGRC|nr:hypothetical protein [Segniliparus rugosus]EFV12726.1 hypothetical protein HMPREF9336_02417 [Segniliparus rugosus ATCC BAA-974]
MFDAQRDRSREEVRDFLLAQAEADPLIRGAAVTGSAAEGREDRWSDIDLFFGATDVEAALSGFSALVYAELGALHHFDLAAGSARYRAFLLPGLLEVDLGFAPAEEWGPLGDGGFRVVFGEPAPRCPASADPDHLVGLAWHHAVHTRTALAREKLFEALHWVNALRDHVLRDHVLACLRHGLPSAYGKGGHLLPEAVAARLRAAIPAQLTGEEIARALFASVDAFAQALRARDPELADRLAPALTQSLH